MKTARNILLLILLLCTPLIVHGQEDNINKQRTPEQEAIKQTEKLQQELNLNSEQTKQVFEINLRYARERQVSNTRSEAMERIKNKTAEIEKILSIGQSNRLQNKRYERTSTESSSMSHSQSVNPPNYRSSMEYRPSQTVRSSSAEMNMRTNYRTASTPVQASSQAPYSVRRNVSTSSRNSLQATTVSPASRPQSVAPAASRSSSSSTSPNRR